MKRTLKLLGGGARIPYPEPANATSFSGWYNEKPANWERALLGAVGFVTLSSVVIWNFSRNSEVK